ncbi:unnamed protein product [Mytilus coruscus]|uniref:Nanos-type domain-containing protein n=1 Tax=Mytilus coruscus TaxID=42192 RepID=A0A6J8EMI2_MYTCO|nr:unnamed protein product [Mytilus coruscus]
MMTTNKTEIDILCELMKRNSQEWLDRGTFKYYFIPDSESKTINELNVFCLTLLWIQNLSEELNARNDRQHSVVMKPTSEQGSEIISDGTDFYMLLEEETKSYLTHKTHNSEHHSSNSAGCTLCRKNGESEKFALSHCLKDKDNIVRCPILRRHICPKCGGTGDESHTLRYCPLRNV